MATENYNYTYTIKNINIEQGTLEINYTPEDAVLSPITLNSFLHMVSYLDIRNEVDELIYSSQDEVPFNVHLENTVKVTAPLLQWKKQYTLIENSTDLVGSQGSITLDPSTVVVPNFMPPPPPKP